MWRGARNANLARALDGCDLEPLDVELAKAAGILCGRAGTTDPVDALVVASAARRGDDIITTDPEDLRALATVATGVGKILDLNDLYRDASDRANRTSVNVRCSATVRRLSRRAATTGGSPHVRGAPMRDLREEEVAPEASRDPGRHDPTERSEGAGARAP